MNYIDYYQLGEKPFVRIVLPFIGGIIFFKLLPLKFSLAYSYILCFLVVKLLLLSIVLKKKFSVFLEISWGILLYVFLFLLGYILSSWHFPENNKINEKGLIVGIVSSKPELKGKYVKTIIETLSLKNEKRWQKFKIKSLLYIEKDDKSLRLKENDIILFKGNVKDIDNLGNPSEFDYKSYLLFKNIEAITYVKTADWQYLDKIESFGIYSFASRCRDYLLDLLKGLNLPSDIYAITSAIVLGYKNEIDADIRQSYSAAGATHILAVSGLHVGVIYMILQWFFGLFSKKKILRWVEFISILLLLWFYALITGLSPSVLRASTMFSFVLISKFINRTTNIYNIISASAFFILLFNPFQLFDIGFQLSYSAVVGIVYFQPKIKGLLNIENKFIDAIWSLVSVTLPAQLATSPLSVYYFNQFPLYFLLSGIVLVPLTSFVIYLALLIFIFSWQSHLTSVFSFILKYLVTFMNSFTLWIENLPLSTISIYIDLIGVIIIYSIIVSLALYFKSKKIIYLYSFLVLVLLNSINFTYRNINNLSQKKIVVYNIPGVSALNLIDGKKNILFVDEDSKNKMANYAGKFWLQLGLEKERIVSFQNFSNQFLLSNMFITDNPNLFFYKDFINFYGYKILIIKDNKFYNLPANLQSLDVDLLIVQKKAKVNFLELLKFLRVKNIIFDSSCSQNKIKKWMQQLTSYKGNIHIVSSQKAMIIDI
jgi:competence protein ComEC